MVFHAKSVLRNDVAGSGYHAGARQGGDREAAMLAVVAVALIGADGQVLMQRRPEGRQHGGLWEFPGGKVEPGESPHQAAARELTEELGVSVPLAALAPVTFAAHPEPPAGGRAVTLMLFAARDWQGVPRAIDAAEIGWFAPHDVPALTMPPLDYPLADGLIAWLGRGAA
ncbi:NUDIX domain-containing protein [Novosphingobium sp. FSY-8]|uniref:8-oxo-dGTP diphosphatase n=2 Tax=Novosphingobium ovatum TaxID=1908523 RepID=A0ABW9XBB0_9SPHN|nr:NUDIX domain-containing protein [Novosphingobium ovatum]